MENSEQTPFEEKKPENAELFFSEALEDDLELTEDLENLPI